MYGGLAIAANILALAANILALAANILTLAANILVLATDILALARPPGHILTIANNVMLTRCFLTLSYYLFQE